MNKRYAAHRVTTPEGDVYEPGYVETEGGAVTHCARLDGELSHTVWLAGLITVESKGARRIARHKGKTLE